MSRNAQRARRTPGPLAERSTNETNPTSLTAPEGWRCRFCAGTDHTPTAYRWRCRSCGAPDALPLDGWRCESCRGTERTPGTRSSCESCHRRISIRSREREARRRGYPEGRDVGIGLPVSLAPGFRYPVFVVECRVCSATWNARRTDLPRCPLCHDAARSEVRGA